ncbi:MAG: hypothetical protein ACK46X_00620 [Candidatus Sericytochromatia bacterium]
MGTMSRLLSLVVSLMVLLTLGLAQAPRVCVGDGLGGACQPAACACVAACSCQEAHRRATVAASEPVSDCCAVDAASIGTSQPTEAGACHGPGTWPHFAPQDRHWYATLATWPELGLFGHPDIEVPGVSALRAHRATAPPEKPPRAA